MRVSCLISIGVALALPAAAAEDNSAYVFSQGFEASVPAPRGGTTEGAPVTLDSEVSPAVEAIQAPGLSDKARDRRAILALAGEYRTTFEFVETAALLADYERDTRPYRSWATEYVFVLNDQPDRIQLQHILVMVFEDDDGGLSEPLVSKHWRQDWHWQPDSIQRYRGDRIWARQATNAPGTWKQSVYQVDDSPRYEAIGRWRHRDGVSQWRSKFFLRPLPRRERSVRDDYDALGGKHRITITPHGWHHSQNNRKLRADGQGWRAIALETGLNRYRRITDRDFDPGRAYWSKTAPFWAAVRAEWRRIQEENPRLRILHSRDGQRLFTQLFAAAQDFDKDASAGQLQKEVAALIAPYVEPKQP